MQYKITLIKVETFFQEVTVGADNEDEAIEMAEKLVANEFKDDWEETGESYTEIESITPEEWHYGGV